MRLSLGSHSYDTATRALVMGVVCGTGTIDEQAADLVAAGADLLDLTGRLPAASTGASGVPVSARPDHGGVVATGVSLLHLHGPEIDPETWAAAVRTRMSVVLTAPPPAEPRAVCTFLVSCARAAEAAGITSDRIVVSAGPHRSADLLRATSRLAALGYPVLVDLEPWPAEDLLGTASLAVAKGARILRTRHVKAARRVADTVAAVLEAA